MLDELGGGWREPNIRLGILQRAESLFAIFLLKYFSFFSPPGCLLRFFLFTTFL
jgi:hypothetical protein